MRTETRRKIEMAARVREFSRAHPSDDAGYATVVARLEEDLARAEAIAARQHGGLVAARGARASRRELRKVLHFQLIRYLVAVGSAAARDRAELAEQFRLPSSQASNQGFLTAAKALVAAAMGQKELLVAEGMSAALLDALQQKLAEFEGLIERARTARRDHIEARSDLEVITTELVEQVRKLDGFNRYRFGKDPDVMAGWVAAKHVPGVATGRAAEPPAPAGVMPPPAAGEGTAPGSGSVAPAA